MRKLPNKVQLPPGLLIPGGLTYLIRQTQNGYSEMNSFLTDFIEFVMINFSSSSYSCMRQYTITSFLTARPYKSFYADWREKHGDVSDELFGDEFALDPLWQIRNIRPYLNEMDEQTPYGRLVHNPIFETI